MRMEEDLDNLIDDCLLGDLEGAQSIGDREVQDIRHLLKLAEGQTPEKLAWIVMPEYLGTAHG